MLLVMQGAKVHHRHLQRHRARATWCAAKPQIQIPRTNSNAQLVKAVLAGAGLSQEASARVLQTPEQHSERLCWLESIGIKPRSKGTELQSLHNLSLDVLQKNLAGLEEHGLTASEAKQVAQKSPADLMRSA